MATQVSVEKKGLREGAIVWLDKNLEGKTYSQRYADTSDLIRIASEARSTLERMLPKISPGRSDVKATYNQHYSALSQLISSLEDSISQMERLRPAFSKSEHRGQLSSYDEQIRKMKETLAGWKEELKWRPYELRGYKPQMVSLQDEEGKFNVQVASLDLRLKPVRTSAVPERAIAKAEAGKGSAGISKSDMVFTEEEIDLRNKALALEAKIKEAKESGKPLQALREERLAAYEKLSELTGEPVPERVKIKRA